MPESATQKRESKAKVRLAVHKNPRLRARIDQKRLQRAAETTLRAEGVSGGVEIGLLVTTDQEMRAFQARYLGLNQTTDVLSFPGPGEALSGPQDEPRYLGDIVISYPQARRQAMEAGQGIGAELELLMVHGLLHLLGYDDQKPAEDAKMRARQEEILAKMGKNKPRTALRKKD
ncbi:MAG: rRNA maturation RNase YbeY [Chloroflexi bacterium]|nr:rRNA maturation RNase YbeY [Chloroflexota bacterium]